MHVRFRGAMGAVAALAFVAAAVTVWTWVVSEVAWADCPPDPVNKYGVCASAGVKVPVDPVDNDPGNPNPPPSAPSCPGAPGGECEKGGFWWSSVGQCYAVPMDPPVAVGSPVWNALAEGATEGTIMYCENGELFYVPAGQTPIPDARTIALNAVKQVPFVTADVHIAPASTEYTYVHLENWLWVPSVQWRDVEATVTVGGTTVTVTAEPSKIEWDMGDNKTKVCRSAGRAWVKGMTDAAKTSCGYAYDTISVKDKAGNYDPDGRFKVTAQFFYEVRWSCTGACSASGGALGEYSGPVSPVTEVEVRQRQTVVKP